MSAVDLQVAHHLIDALLMLGFAEAGQVRVKRGDGRTGVAQIDLELAEVLPILKQMRRVGMAKAVNMRCLLDAASLEGQAESSLQSRAAHRLGSGRRFLTSSLTFARKEQHGIAMSLP